MSIVRKAAVTAVAIAGGTNDCSWVSRQNRWSSHVISAVPKSQSNNGDHF